MNSRFAPCLALASCLTAACLAAEPTGNQPPQVEPLSRGRSAQIVGNADTIAAALAQQMANTRDARQNAMFDDVRDVMAHSSEWRWYSRDHGILLAIPVRERLGIFAKVNGENMLADVVRRLIYQQGWGNPPVQVVFIEPELPCPTPRGCNPCGAAATATDVACGCR